MNRSVAMALSGIVCFAGLAIVLDTPSGLGQRPATVGPPGIRGARGELGSRISGERITRQSEVLRLQESIDRLQSRVQRLERLTISGGGFPAFTIEESEAEIEFAQAQLDARQREAQAGEATEVEVAADRLQLVRARSQLTLARAAHLDRKLALELDVADANRKLIEETQQQQVLQSLVAKGYASAAGWELQQADVEVAKKLLLRARSRLELFEDRDPIEKQAPSPPGDETAPTETAD